MKPQVTFDEERREVFLKALAARPNVSAAADAAGIYRGTAYHRRETDPDFAEAWKQALAIGIDALEEEGLRRAKDGVPRVRVSGGEVVLIPVLDENGHVQFDDEGRMIKEPLVEMHYSDTIWCKLMEAHRSELYRQRTDVNVSAPGGAVLNLIEKKVE